MQSFEQATELLPLNLREVINKTDIQTKKNTREIRLRINQPLSLTLAQRSVFISQNGITTDVNKGIKVNKSDIDETFSLLCRHCLYSTQEQIRQGFITAKGGHRAGICGTATVKNGQIEAIRDISSINIRIARQIIGCADKIYNDFFNNEISSTLIASAPAGGKTTILRDLARTLSEKGKRVSVIDERGELGAVFCGVAQNRLGALCDILDNYPKAQGITYAVRCLNPQAIICDEIGAYEDYEAVSEAFKSGVPLIMSVHASSLEELKKRRNIYRLIEEALIKNIIVLEGEKAPGKIKESIII
ncbi:MAG: stage III sporulation protein AA [Ruminococcaceae bacterium]|nr:stage III sporulation protein AA [Oscillospiraceae bacterium]